MRIAGTKRLWRAAPAALSVTNAGKSRRWTAGTIRLWRNGREPEQEETEDAAVFTITAFDVLNEGTGQNRPCWYEAGWI